MVTNIKETIEFLKDFEDKNPDLIKIWKEFDALPLDEKLKLKSEKELEFQSMEEGELKYEFYIKYRPVLRFYVI